MKTRRHETDAARKRYESQRYPGDLAADLEIQSLSRFRFGSRQCLQLAAVTAAVGLMVWLLAPSATEVSPRDNQPVAVEPSPPSPSPKTLRDDPPASVGVRLSEVPTLRRSTLSTRSGLNIRPTRPQNLRPGFTPNRFPDFSLKRPDSPPPSSRRPADEHPDPTLT